ncbi:lipid II-degrading bacteriocin [Pseudomonas protegens]|uniref:lipid II-degrading bacteriocin n=1 Tax=Pseudomonas protegens TaxID=380021 RepID=UPI00381D587F
MMLGQAHCQEVFYHRRRLLLIIFGGDGQNLNANINTIGLNLKTSDIPLLSQTIRHNTELGSVHVSTNIGYDALKSSLKTGSYLGSITLKAEGDFNKEASGAWTFKGVVRGHQDKYDFNEAARGHIAETFTTLGRVAKGANYNIDITGESKISLVGFGTHAD